MSKITPHMISVAYDAYFNFAKDITPVVEAGMNPTSAEMSMVWFDHIFSGKLYRRTGSAMQIEWVLNKLVEEGDQERLAMVLKSLRLYVDFYSEKPMNKVRALVDQYQEKLVKVQALAKEPQITELVKTTNQPLAAWPVLPVIAIVVITVVAVISLI
jgi:hypothetical protein